MRVRNFVGPEFGMDESPFCRKRTKREFIRGPWSRFVAASVAILSLSGCLVHSRPVQVRMSTMPPQTATYDELIRRVNSEAAKIQTLNATVGITASEGGVKRGRVTDYQQIRGYILARKPSYLRMIGLFPILQNRVFDMVSNGQEFKLWIPPKNQFIVGNNDLPRPGAQPLANLRPQVIYETLLIQPIDVLNDVVVLEEGDHEVLDPRTKRTVLTSEYTLDIIKSNSHGWYLSRKTVFDRTDLHPHKQVIYDENGVVVTEATYDQFTDFNGFLFPARIQIWRPLEEFSITLTVFKLTVNQSLRDDQFILEEPPSARLCSDTGCAHVR